jgi:transketolase
MRAALSEILVNLARRDSNVILLTGDHGYSLFDDFRRECPSQYINAGVAEQNMVGMASGLARLGFRPIVYGLSAFIPIRVLEQIKLDVALDNLPIIFIGDGAGFVYSHLGSSHQSLEDIACTRAIPNLSIYSPADRFELTQCMELAYRENSPIYLRLGKADRGDIHKSLSILEPRKILKVKTGIIKECSFLATGSMVRTAIDIAVESYPEASVWSVPIIKPINNIQIEKICRDSKAIVVFEEHSKYGGLGSLVAEISAEHSPIKILRIAVNDCFSEKCGTYEYLLKEHGLDIETIQANIRSFLRNV